eukprot:CAMPEP_0181297736 /NCGR_PEP_ID=MMETSP1101-20121128/5404_1 /TAXON_ID=46948 /ORGANISM="Rhodomonas abbreviata, Strain Caron Lab Isolate" /LENGTH=399 /DNA_ID=CAMNT_0023402703 /DNA_START=61 /DNA_END=1261 /DNA_ORIENTATION=-
MANFPRARKLSLSNLSEEVVQNNFLELEVPLISTPLGEVSESVSWWSHDDPIRNGPIDAPVVAPSDPKTLFQIKVDDDGNKKNPFHIKIEEDACALKTRAWSWLDSLAEDLPAHDASWTCHPDEICGSVVAGKYGRTQDLKFAPVPDVFVPDLFVDVDGGLQRNSPCIALFPNNIGAGCKRKAPEEESFPPKFDSVSDCTLAKTKKQAKGVPGQRRYAEARMQQNAREGQRHWGLKVQELREQWDRMRMWEQNPHFSAQIQMCARMHIKSQHECILRQLQIAAVDGILTPHIFSSDGKQSFIGWTGFQLADHSGMEFRRRIEGMFASPPNEKTLNNTLRRAGMVPEYSWGEAWCGIGCFLYDPEKRAHYGGVKEDDRDSPYEGTPLNDRQELYGTTSYY